MINAVPTSSSSDQNPWTTKPSIVSNTTSTAAASSSAAGSTPTFTPQSKKKFNLKYILGGLVLILLLVGATAGFYLTQFTNLDVRQQAFEDQSGTGTGLYGDQTGGSGSKDDTNVPCPTGQTKNGQGVCVKDSGTVVPKPAESNTNSQAVASCYQACMGAGGNASLCDTQCTGNTNYVYTPPSTGGTSNPTNYNQCVNAGVPSSVCTIQFPATAPISVNCPSGSSPYNGKCVKTSSVSVVNGEIKADGAVYACSGSVTCPPNSVCTAFGMCAAQTNSVGDAGSTIGPAIASVLNPSAPTSSGTAVDVLCTSTDTSGVCAGYCYYYTGDPRCKNQGGQPIYDLGDFDIAGNLIVENMNECVQDTGNKASCAAVVAFTPVTQLPAPSTDVNYTNLVNQYDSCKGSNSGTSQTAINCAIQNNASTTPIAGGGSWFNEEGMTCTGSAQAGGTITCTVTRGGSCSGMTMTGFYSPTGLDSRNTVQTNPVNYGAVPLGATINFNQYMTASCGAYQFDLNAPGTADNQGGCGAITMDLGPCTGTPPASPQPSVPPVTPPTDTPPGESPPPPVYGCNSACTSDTQCQSANANMTCNTAQGNRCRLTSNPTAANCQPAVGPMCLSIALNNVTNPSAPATQDPRPGDAVTLTCGEVAGAARYTFRVIEPDGVITNLAATGRTSATYTISKTGNYAAQCQICTGAADNTCMPYEPL